MDLLRNHGLRAELAASTIQYSGRRSVNWFSMSGYLASFLLGILFTWLTMK